MLFQGGLLQFLGYASFGMRVHFPRHGKESRACRIAKPAEETSRAQKQNGGSRKYFPVFQVGYRGVPIVARLRLGWKFETSVLTSCCRRVVIFRRIHENEGSMHSPVGVRAWCNPGFPGNKHAQWFSHRRT